ALACAFAAVLVRWALHPILGSRLVFVTAFLTVLASARFWGVGPSILAGLVGLSGIALLTDQHDPITILVNLLVYAISISVIDVLRRANLKAEHSARLAEERLQQLREESTQRLREAQVSAQFRAVVESSVDAIISKDLNGIIQSWNHSAEQIFGYSAQEVI